VKVISERMKTLKITGALALVALPVVLSGCGNSGGSGMSSSGGNSGSAGIATVDGTPITRGDLQAYAEVKAGAQALSELIDYELVMNELKAKGLSVSDAEVDTRIALQQRDADPKSKEQFDKVMQLGGLHAEAIKRQARLTVALNKLLTKDVKATDAQVKAWFDKNKARLYPVRAKVGMLLSSQKARADAMARQLSSKAKTFKQLVDEQQKLNDPIGKGSMEESPSMEVDENLPPALRSAVLSTKPGEVSKVITIPGGQGRPTIYAIVRVVEKKEISYEADRAQIEQDYKLEQVARNEMKTSSPGMKFEDAIKQVKQSVMQQAMMQGRMPGPMGDNEAVAYINRTTEQNLINKLRQNGKVQISDAFYVQMNDMYKAAPAPGSITPGGATGNTASSPTADGHSAGDGHGH
jgi:hypothetical protein